MSLRCAHFWFSAKVLLPISLRPPVAFLASLLPSPSLLPLFLDCLLHSLVPSFLVSTSLQSREGQESMRLPHAWRALLLAKSLSSSCSAVSVCTIAARAQDRPSHCHLIAKSCSRSSKSFTFRANLSCICPQRKQVMMERRQRSPEGLSFRLGAPAIPATSD